MIKSTRSTNFSNLFLE